MFVERVATLLAFSGKIRRGLVMQLEQIVSSLTVTLVIDGIERESEQRRECKVKGGGRMLKGMDGGSID